MIYLTQLKIIHLKKKIETLKPKNLSKNYLKSIFCANFSVPASVISETHTCSFMCFYNYQQREIPIQVIRLIVKLKNH